MRPSEQSDFTRDEGRPTGDWGGDVMIEFQSVHYITTTDDHYENVSIQSNFCVLLDKVCDLYSDSNCNNSFEVSGQCLYTDEYMSQETVDGPNCQILTTSEVSNSLFFT